MNLTDINEINALLHRHDFRFSKSMGQNFLVESWVPRQIAEEALISEEDGVLEVGPGIGCLTVQLAERAAQVSCLELDESLQPLLSETLAGCENVTVTFADALKTDLAAHCREVLGERPWRVCANLPYNVATPLITEFLRCGIFQSITVMIQKEVAGRICAKAGDKDYGAFSVLTQWYAAVEELFDVPPSCFLPQPKVTSTVIRLVPRSTPPADVADEDFFFRTVRGAFLQRRKTLSNSLRSAFSGFSREAIVEAIAECGLPETVRGEALTIPQFAALSNALYKRK